VARSDTHDKGTRSVKGAASTNKEAIRRVADPNRSSLFRPRLASNSSAQDFFSHRNQSDGGSTTTSCSRRVRRRAVAAATAAAASTCRAYNRAPLRAHVEGAVVEWRKE